MKIVITDKSAILKCKNCGATQEINQYGDWSIGSSTISYCKNCGKTTNHNIVAQIVETVPYNEYIENTLVVLQSSQKKLV